MVRAIVRGRLCTSLVTVMCCEVTGQRHVCGCSLLLNSAAVRAMQIRHTQSDSMLLLLRSQEPSVSKTATSNVSAPQPSGVRPEQSDGDFLSSGRSPQALHRAPAPSTSGNSGSHAKRTACPEGSKVSTQQPSWARPEQSAGDFLSSGRRPQAPNRVTAPGTSRYPSSHARRTACP